MPPPRKVDLLPKELRQWLQEELRNCGFSQYERIAEALNFRCEEEGLELRIGKSAIHSYGQEFREYALMQERAQDEIRTFLQEASLKDEADVTSALFQQLTTIQWRLQMMMSDATKMPDPRGMKDLTTALNNLIRSSSLRDGIIKAERARIAAEERANAVEALDSARDELGLSSDVIGKLRREFLGVRA
ncbi:hypothetical protein RTM1035_05135 [Roseovarius sp. TM1035]|jgi:hypothetical protein|uniref:phage protein Gp27 family protein n=1 Tax=unclassified Roseovarius TaxID=2614913 RepID=UPI0001556AFB|nr:phage protein Gp27 family protein [Roseovarius sp. TM1035]AWZ21094.1 Protein gp27 [Roseovarius sp. AK1035]EDM32974.1 hypothetical protein RTM1035_05135 [Roseovarius sp. TM1035]